MTKLFYQVLTPNGWVNPEEVKKIYSVNRNLEISSEEVKETVEVDTLIHYTSADQTWSGFTAWDLSLLYFQDDFGVANGDFQHTDLTVGEMTGKHLFTNIGNLRVTVPTKFECMDFQILDDTRYPNYFVNLVKSKNVGLKVQHFSKLDALSFLDKGYLLTKSGMRIKISYFQGEVKAFVQLQSQLKQCDRVSPLL